MLHLIPIDRKPFESPDDYIYSRMTFDGMYFYCCTGKSSKIFKLNIDGKLICCIDTKRAYCSICFDCGENCFWALTKGCRNSVFKLNSSFCEIGSINFPFQDRWYHNISYDTLGDILILCSGDMVVKLSKSGEIIPLHSEGISIYHESAAQLFDSYLVGCNFQTNAPNTIGILSPNHNFDYLTCMPKQFSLNSMCVGYGHERSDTLFVLASQNYRYSYLLTYRIEWCGQAEKIHLPPFCNNINDEQIIRISIDKLDIQTDIVI